MLLIKPARRCTEMNRNEWLRIKILGVLEIDAQGRLSVLLASALFLIFTFYILAV
jgi:hypothetical protein